MKTEQIKQARNPQVESVFEVINSEIVKSDEILSEDEIENTITELEAMETALKHLLHSVK